jgi:hypothetical protein
LTLRDLQAEQAGGAGAEEPVVADGDMKLRGSRYLR